MELPAGKLEETSFGGPGVLRDFLERIKDSQITGALRVSAMRENVQSIGSIVFKGGHCTLALHDYFGPLYSGEALKEIMRDSCLLYTSPSPRDVEESRMPSSA